MGLLSIINYQEPGFKQFFANAIDLCIKFIRSETNIHVKKIQIPIKMETNHLEPI
jgi:hypothetical protein